MNFTILRSFFVQIYFFLEFTVSDSFLMKWILSKKPFAQTNSSKSYNSINFMIVLFYKSSCRVPPNFTSYEAQSETNLAFPYLCGLLPLQAKQSTNTSQSRQTKQITQLFLWFVRFYMRITTWICKILANLLDWSPLNVNLFT